MQVTYRHIGKDAKCACSFPHPRHVSSSELACGFHSADKGSGSPWCPVGSMGWALFCWFGATDGRMETTEKGNVIIPLKVSWLSHARTHRHTHLPTRTYPRTYSPSTSQTSMPQLPAKRVKRRCTLPASCRYVAASLTLLYNCVWKESC